MEKLKIRHAVENDIPGISRLLYQVHKVHSDVRPDLFRPGGKKYTEDELKAIINDDKRPVFVAESDNGVIGYAFCIHRQILNDTSLTDVRTLYIDDLCVDQQARGRHIGESLFEYVKQQAKEQGCYEVTLNVWAGNTSAEHFYEKMGMKTKERQMEYIL